GEEENRRRRSFFSPSPLLSSVNDSRVRAGAPASLAGRRRLLRGGGARRGRSVRRSRSALVATLAARRVRLVLTPAAARLLAAAGFPVNGRPGAALRLAGRHPAVLVPFGDVLRLAFLLARVLRLFASRHRGLLCARDDEPLKRPMCKSGAEIGLKRPLAP